MKDVYFCMLTNNQSTINHKIPFYTAKSYHSTIPVWYEGPGVSRLRHFLFIHYWLQIQKCNHSGSHLDLWVGPPFNICVLVFRFSFKCL